MIDFLKHLWPSPRPARGEYRNTIQSCHVVRLARKWDERDRRIWERMDCTCESDGLGRCVVHEELRRQSA